MREPSAVLSIYSEIEPRRTFEADPEHTLRCRICASRLEAENVTVLFNQAPVHGAPGDVHQGVNGAVNVRHCPWAIRVLSEACS